MKDWAYTYFLEKEVNENISNCLALQKQKSEEYKDKIQEIICKI